MYMIPTTIKEELTYNVFLRAFDKDVQALTYTDNTLDCFKAIRLYKDEGKEPEDTLKLPEPPKKKAMYGLVRGTMRRVDGYASDDPVPIPEGEEEKDHFASLLRNSGSEDSDKGKWFSSRFKCDDPEEASQSEKEDDLKFTDDNKTKGAPNKYNE